VKIIEEQKKNGEVTLTHEEMTRFWITLDQGVELVLTALSRMHGGEIFVPKIPSMRVKDFIMKLAPDARVRIIGIRPGEKLHEVLVTPEEALHAVEYPGYYVILPEHDGRLRERYADGAPLPQGFFYSSATNTDWLDADRLQTLMNAL
jgi:UDP-N-acetylglucosamine 4,6-dehydratase